MKFFALGNQWLEKSGGLYYDFDDVNKKYYHYTLESFLNLGTSYERMKKRVKLTHVLVNRKGNKVLVITPMRYKKHVNQMLEMRSMIIFRFLNFLKNKKLEMIVYSQNFIYIYLF